MKLRTLIAAATLAGLSLQSMSVAHAQRAWTSAAGSANEMVFALTGDSIIMRRLSRAATPDPEPMYNIIRGADAAFTNFETLIHPYNNFGAQQSGGTYITSPPFISEELEWAGFDLLSLANNHTNDYGIEGMRSTVEALSKSNMVFSGVGENLAFARAPGYLDTPKGRVALISVSSSFPAAIAAGAQRRDLPGRPGLNPLRHTVTYTVPQEVFNVLSELRGPARGWFANEAEGTLNFAGATYQVGPEVAINTKADERDLRELVASVRDARQQADWVMVSIHHHESIHPGDRSQPAEFGVEFAHAMVDAGADMVVGHGHHMLRGIEIYNGKPIFYSLANFIFENDLVAFQPAENYERQGLPETALPGDFYTRRTRGDTTGFPADRRYWQSVVAEVIFNKDDERSLKEVRLHPISLGYGNPRTRRGQPYPAPREEVEQIMQDLQEVSAPFGTNITVRRGMGIITGR